MNCFEETQTASRMNLEEKGIIGRVEFRREEPKLEGKTESKDWKAKFQIENGEE